MLAYDDDNPDHHWEYLGELLIDGTLVSISSREGFDVGHLSQVLLAIERGGDEMASVFLRPQQESPLRQKAWSWSGNLRQHRSK